MKIAQVLIAATISSSATLLPAFALAPAEPAGTAAAQGGSPAAEKPAEGAKTPAPSQVTPDPKAPEAQAKDGTVPMQVPEGSGGTPPARILGKGKPPPELLKQIERNRVADEKAAALENEAKAHADDVHYQIEWMQGLLDLGKVDEALDHAPPLVMKFPRSSDLLTVFGRALLKDGEFDLAALQFQRAIALDDKNARAHALAGRIGLIRGDLKSGETALRKALSLDSTQREAQSDLSVLLERAGRYSEAAAVGNAPEPDASGGQASSVRRERLLEYTKAPPFVLPDGFSAVTVPFTTARGYPPMIRVKVGESFEMFFVVDTASDETILTQDAAKALGLPERGKELFKDEAGHFHETAAYTILDEVRMGDLIVKRVPIRVTPGLKYPSDQIAGSIGRSFLRRFRLTLDYPGRTVTFSRADAPPLDGVHFDFTTVLLIDGQIGERPAGKFVLDTASYTPGSMDIAFVEEEVGLNLFSEGVTALPQGPYLFKFTMPGLTVGGVEFKDFPATAVDLRGMARAAGVNVRGVVGVSYLRQCRLEIDFKNQRLSLKRTAESPKPEAEIGT